MFGSFGMMEFYYAPFLIPVIKSHNCPWYLAVCSKKFYQFYQKSKQHQDSKQKAEQISEQKAE